MVKRKKVDSATVRKNPVRSVRKEKHQIASFNESIASARCKDWLMEQKKIKKEIKEETTKPVSVTEIVTPTESQTLLPTVKLKTRGPRQSWKKIKHLVDFTCEWKRCNAEISDETEYDEHVMEHSVGIIPNEDLYECLWDLCGFVSNDYNALTRHLSFHIYHSKLKTYGDSYRQTIDFPQCSYDSRNRNFFPDADFDYNCLWQNCNQKFNSVVDFLYHVKLAHCNSLFKGVAMSCKWESCTKTFSKQAFLACHVMVHTREKLVACPHCGAMFRNNSHFFDHCERQLVNNTHEFQCEHCHKYFASERLLRIHMRGHINSLKCTLCDMSCSKPYDLARHIRYKHMQEKPFTCKFCTFRAVTKHDILTHQTIHFDETHECNKLECNFKTNSGHLLKKHMLNAHGRGLKSFACHCCDQMYNYSQLLSRHLQNKHNFQHPAGHSRFTYKKCADEIYRLQTVRVESLDVTKQIILKNDEEVEEEEEKEEVEEEGLVEDSSDVETEENMQPPIIKMDEFSIIKVEEGVSDMEPLYVDDEYDDLHYDQKKFENANCIKSIDDFKIMKYLKTEIK